MEHNNMHSRSHQKGFGWPHVFFTLILLGVLGLIFVPMVFRTYVGSSGAEALNNAKNIARGLNDFKADYGMYPCPETRELINKTYGSTLSMDGESERIRKADDANAYLAQLIVTDIIDSETYFYASGAIKGAIKGDDIKSTPEKLLSRGENGFAYLMTRNQEPLSDVKSDTPLVIAPIKKSDNADPVFDPGPYADHYVYGAADGSAKSGRIDKNGRAKSKEDKHLFQTGPDSLFGDQVPVVKYPLGL